MCYGKVIEFIAKDVKWTPYSNTLSQLQIEMQFGFPSVGKPALRFVPFVLKLIAVVMICRNVSPFVFS